jgi:hypothetical protein
MVVACFGRCVQKFRGGAAELAAAGDAGWMEVAAGAGDAPDMEAGRVAGKPDRRSSTAGGWM